MFVTSYKCYHKNSFDENFLYSYLKKKKWKSFKTYSSRIIFSLYEFVFPSFPVNSTDISC